MLNSNNWTFPFVLAPTVGPTLGPTKIPSVSPSCSPTVSPSKGPSYSPTKSPTTSPTPSPTGCFAMRVCVDFKLWDDFYEVEVDDNSDMWFYVSEKQWEIKDKDWVTY